MTRSLIIAALACFAALPVAAEDALKVTRTADNALPTEPVQWLGKTPHFVMKGTVNGYEFDVEYQDISKATGIASFKGKREYKADGESHRYVDFEFTLQAVIAGQEKEIELEFENHDFSSFTMPQDFVLQSEEFPKGTLSNMEVEFEWEAEGVSVNQEVAGWDGFLQLIEDSGHADDKGLIGDGQIGGFVTAGKGEDSLTISFTVPVTEYEIDD